MQICARYAVVRIRVSILGELGRSERNGETGEREDDREREEEERFIADQVDITLW